MAFILDDILLAPCNFVSWIGEQLREEAESQLTDESVIQRGLLELQSLFEQDQISEEEYIDQENALMHRLDEIRKYKESQQKR